jgi:hypothetical protein
MMAQLLIANGVYMGKPLNKTLDYLGDDGRYGQCMRGYLNAASKYGSGVKWTGRSWAFPESALPPAELMEPIMRYVEPIMLHGEPCGYKNPQSTLMLPWLVRQFPDAKFLHIERGYAGATRTPHATDDLARWGVPGPNNPLASWVYQREIVAHMAKPVNWCCVKYEEFCRSPQHWVELINAALGLELTMDGFSVKEGKG